MLETLFKEEQLYHPSIHLHALSYTVRVVRKVNFTVDTKHDISDRITRLEYF